MNKKITISYKAFFIMAAVYLALPVIIFFLGYLKLVYGIILTLAMAASLVLAIRDCARDPDGGLVKSKEVEFPVKFLVIGAVVAVVLTILNGVGELVWGPYDHAFRRAILDDLIDYKWPIIYDPATQTDPYVKAIMNLNGPQGFVYYFTYWMPAAVIGKLFGFAAGNTMLILWNSMGIFITFIGMSIYLKRATYASMVMLICFSGLDVIPYLIDSVKHYEAWFWIEGWVSHISYISNFNSLENVYHQAVPCYIIITMILLAKNNRNLGFTAGMIFAYSPWVTIGMIVPALTRMLCPDLKAKTAKKRITSIFSVNNLLMPVLLLFIFGMFYSAKSDSVHDRGFVWDYYGSIPVFLLVYVLFIILEVLPSFVFVVGREKKNPMLWAAVFMLLICPLYKMTESNDFTMRVSMPALFIMCIFMTQTVSEYTLEDIEIAAKRKPKRKLKENIRMALFALVLIGMSYIAYYMTTAIYSATFFGDYEEWPHDDIVSFGNVAGPAYADKIQDQFFVEGPENTFFFKYLAS